MTLILPSDEGVLLAEALQPEPILCRILWIVENTLNIQLLEKVAMTGFNFPCSFSFQYCLSNLLLTFLNVSLAI